MKYLLLLLILPLLIIPTVYAIPGIIPFDEFCETKTDNYQTSAADFICELDIFQMKDDIASLEDRVALIEAELILDVLVEISSMEGIGDVLHIIVTRADGTVSIDIIAEDGEIIDTLSIQPSNQGEINTPWVIPKETPFGIYTVRVTDSNTSVETTFTLSNLLIT